MASARAHGLDRLDAQLLLAHALQRPRAWLLAHGDAALAPPEAAAFGASCRRRAEGVPVAYILGRREFHGLLLEVDGSVLVPRPETEMLVDWALALLEGELRARPAPTVVDLGTGSGAIALAIRANCPRAHVWAVERSGPALALARANAARLALPVEFVRGDWWRALARQAPAFDLAVANPPYIAQDDPHLPALAHEPREALVAAGNGLADLRAIVQRAPLHLAAGAWLLMEHGWTQAGEVQQALRQAGFADVQTRADLAGHPRCTGGRLIP
ncbi:MAG TPA: peptide chain release factor N(5)-glutamine methyltransferase [Burkholderiaceae bacterium]|nr:peptide chain release factor N(5)-glutamine methyltransferase [Burkholderiaceae bacterium]